jgi:mono/diheme cytochrome c family protein
MTQASTIRTYYRISAASILASVAIAFAFNGCNSDQKANAADQKTVAAPVNLAERGKYLVTAVAGCNDCHTPFKMGEHGPEPDMTRMLSGHPEQFKLTLSDAPKVDMRKWVMTASATNTAFAGPWGISFAMNLTPDSVTGMGTWTEDMFIKTMRSGKHWATARPIMPPMPQPAFAHMTDEDLKSIFAYLQTIPKVHNQVPDYTPPVQP